MNSILYFLYPVSCILYPVSWLCTCTYLFLNPVFWISINILNRSEEFANLIENCTQTAIPLPPPFTTVWCTPPLRGPKTRYFTNRNWGPASPRNLMLLRFFCDSVLDRTHLFPNWKGCRLLLKPKVYYSPPPRGGILRGHAGPGDYFCRNTPLKMHLCFMLRMDQMNIFWKSFYL